MTETADQSHRFGVLIASSAFPEEPKLQDLACPENDVDGLQEVLSDNAIGGFSELLVVKNEPSHVALRKIHKVLRKAGRDDFVLIYYAGHGKTDLAGRLHLATKETVNEELETTSIPAQRIRALIDNARTTKVALILDCCYSGAIEKSFLRGDVEDQLNIMAGGRGTFIMTASTDVQTAKEEVRDGYGVFTKHLIDGIRGAADVDGDGIVTMNELYDYVHREVVAESHQVPMKWNLNVQGEMVIAQSGHKPREARRQMLRGRLFELADKGVLPDMVFTKALEVSNLSFEETRQGAAARYDQLLDRLLDPDVHVGKFLDQWLQVPADDAPGPGAKQRTKTQHKATPEAEPATKTEEEPAEEPQRSHRRAAKPKRQGAKSKQGTAGSGPWRRSRQQPKKVGLFWRFMVFPYPATQENLDHHPLYRLFHGKAVREREMAEIAAGGKPGTTWSDVMICLGWIAAGIPVMAAFSIAFDENGINYFRAYREEESGIITGASVWAFVGWMLMKRASHRLRSFIKLLYFLGILACIGFALVVLSEI